MSVGHFILSVWWFLPLWQELVNQPTSRTLEKKMRNVWNRQLVVEFKHYCWLLSPIIKHYNMIRWYLMLNHYPTYDCWPLSDAKDWTNQPPEPWLERCPAVRVSDLDTRLLSVRCHEKCRTNGVSGHVRHVRKPNVLKCSMVLVYLPASGWFCGRWQTYIEHLGYTLNSKNWKEIYRTCAVPKPGNLMAHQYSGDVQWRGLLWTTTAAPW